MQVPAPLALTAIQAAPENSFVSSCSSIQFLLNLNSHLLELSRSSRTSYKARDTNSTTWENI